MSVAASSREKVLTGEPVAVRLMNTMWGDAEGVHDSLETTAELRYWLESVDIPVPEVTDEDLESARELRDSLRRLGALIADDPRKAAESPATDTSAVDLVNRLADQRPTDVLSLNAGRLVRTSPGGRAASRGLATIAADARSLLSGPEATQLRACLAPGCVRYFMKQHSRREWCCEACGNRARAARHYGRVRAQRLGTPPAP